MVTWGNEPRHGHPGQRPPAPPRGRSRTPAPGARPERALEYMGLQPGQAIAGQPVDVVFIGSCTNSRISDLRLAASVLEGRHVADGVRLMIVPGSQQVKAQAEREGLHEIFRAAGAEWRESGCSMCIAMNGDQLSPGQYAISTSNRNFEGRQGKGGRTFLASPLTAAASAIIGRRHRPADPARHRGPGHRRRRVLTMPEPFRGFASTVVPLAAENVDTDQIVPARYLKVTDKEGLADALFRDWRFNEDGSQKDPPFVLDRPGMAGPQDPARRRQLRHRQLARARAVGAPRAGASGPSCRPRSRTSSAATRSRTACCRSSSTRRPTGGCSSSSSATPTPSSASTSPSRGSCSPTDRRIDFDIDPFAKLMLLAGTDEIGYVLDHEDAHRRLGGRPPAARRHAHRPGDRGLTPGVRRTPSHVPVRAPRNPARPRRRLRAMTTAAPAPPSRR